MINKINSNRENIAPYTVFFMAALYVVYISFNLPHMTYDELQGVANPFSYQMIVNIESGRISHHIALLINQAIGFVIPDFEGMLKRAVVIFLFFVVLYLYLRHMNFEKNISSILVFLALFGHQLDWQHNGMLSFFGGYLFYLSCFLISIILYEKQKGFFISFVLSSFFLILSFSSEVFVGLSVLYFIGIYFSKNKVFFNPHFYFSILYFFLYFYMQRYTSTEKSLLMADYTLGSIKAFSFIDIIEVWGLYLYYSIPYLDLIKYRPNGILILFFVIFLLGIALYRYFLAFGFRTLLGWHYLLWVTLLLGPQFLISLQPMKAQWMLDGASSHYVFSFYTWISLLVLVLMFFKKKEFIFLSVLLFPFLVFVLLKNVGFIENYKPSIIKWKAIELEADRAKENNEDSIKLLHSDISHPFISSIPENIMAKLIFKEYEINTYFCRKNSIYDFSVDSDLDLTGFYDSEPGGKWIKGTLAEVGLPNNIQKGDRVLFKFSNYIQDLNEKPIVIATSKEKSAVYLDDLLVAVYEFTENIELPTIKIEVANSYRPIDIGINTDTRDLSLMIKSIEIWRKVDGNYMLDDSSSCELVKY